MCATMHDLGERTRAWVDSATGHGTPNAGLIIDDDAITLVDTLAVASQWGPFGHEVDSLGLPIRRVVLTSSHIEYVGGTNRFALAARYGRAQTSAHLDQPPNLDGYRRLFPALASQFDDDFATQPITHTIDEAAWLTISALTVPTAGQQLENLVVQVPTDNVLFAGAMCCFGVTPNCFDGSPGTWADALADIAGWGDTIVPGLGPVGGPDDVVALRAYLYACVEAEGDPMAIPSGPWDNWTDRDLDIINIERAAMLADDNPDVPPSMLKRLGLTN